MNTKLSNINKGLDLIGRMPASKNRVFLAVGLISLMTFMWIRVFVRAGSDSNNVSAAPVKMTESQAIGQSGQRQVKLSYIQLPVIPGRNDMLKRDIFSVKNCRTFDAYNKNGTKHGKTDTLARIQDTGGDPDITEIEKKLRLEAVIAGDNGQPGEAFIENQFVSVGSTLAVDYDGRIYEFTVLKIDENEVVLKWKEFTIAVKMSPSDETN